MAVEKVSGGTSLIDVLDRVLDKLVSATTRLGEDYTLLQDAYQAVLQHRMIWFSAVAKQVGGVVEEAVSDHVFSPSILDAAWPRP